MKLIKSHVVGIMVITLSEVFYNNKVEHRSEVLQIKLLVF